LKEKTVLLIALLILMVPVSMLNVSEAGTVWAIEVVDSSGDMGYYCSLALDSSNNPHISYHDYDNRDLKYASWTGASWNIETVDSSGDVGRYPSLVLDSTGNPHISYGDLTNGDLKYEVGVVVYPIGSISISGGYIYTNSTEVTLTLTYSATAATVTDIRLSNDGVWDTETWETPATSKAWSLTSGDGTKTVFYQVRDSDGDVSIIYSDKILLQSPTPTPSPSPAPTPTPSPTAASSPSPSPTPTTSPSPSPTPLPEEPPTMMYVALGVGIGAVAAGAIVTIFLRKGK
jgi:hypothetical protein